jgi:hypothetical protein
MDLMPLPQARVIPLGEPIEGGAPLFEGALVDARRFLENMTSAERDAVSIRTPEHLLTTAAVPGHEHHPAPEARA